MKKVSLLLVVCMLLTLCGCGSENVKIEDHTWQMLTITPSDDGSKMLYCSPAYLEAFPDMEGVQALDLVLTAKDGTFTITDNTNGKTYEGSYEETGEDKMPGSADQDTGYGLVLGELPGIATAYNEYPFKGAEVGSVKDRHALFVMIDGYCLQFLADGVFESDFATE